MASYKLVLLLVCVSSCVWARTLKETGVGDREGPGCVDTDPAQNYMNQYYEGVWYEIGRLQTPGGAFFQAGCHCETTYFTSPSPDVGDGEATYTCRKDGPNGELTSATADLHQDGAAGHFKQQFRYPLSPSLDYTIIYIDQDTAVEYDCGTNRLDVTNYCVHFMSRTPTMDTDKLQQLVLYAESLGLNNQNLNFTATKQEGCW
ncbi:hypothetical protein Pmani_013749 [Petrolisthes manimaculis]|uniref:Lipocalin/cytosolic fatty-acid binding domain-containing protein n=1 Tax=Petrolisthes manimaculis TaxID=1843537 RepID=A0AAE1PVG2_9EUCA|nr:hypothetical protein Pmani_013749 [Petrolisthes manimaculis]